MAILTSAFIGGTLARRLLPVVIVLPVFLGWLRLEGQRAGFYGLEVGLTLATVTNITVLTLVILYHAALLNRTDERRAVTESALSAKKEQYRTLIDHIPDVAWSADQQGRVVFISHNTLRICGYSPEAICTEGCHPYFAIIHPDDLGRVKDAYEALFRRSERFDVEYRICAINGDWLWIHDRALATYEKNGIAYADGLFTDITGRKKTELALQENESRLVKAQRIAHIGYWDWDVAADTLTWSKELYAISGRDPVTFTPTLDAVFACIHPEDRDKLRNKLENARRTGQPYDNEHRLVRPDGSIRTVHCQGEVSVDATRTAVRLFGTVQDVTERIRSEEALRQSEARFRWLFECDMIGIGFWGLAGEITDANDALLKIVGYSRDDLAAARLDWRKLTPSEHLPRDEAAMQEIARRGVITPFEKDYLHRDGHRVPVLIGAATYPETTDSGVFFVLDLTRQKQAEAQQRKLSLAVEHSPSAVIITDRNARIEYANPKFYSLTGYSPEEIIGQTSKILQSGLTPAATYEELWTTILTGQAWRGEFHDRRKNGEIYWCLQSIAPVKNDAGEIVNFVSVTEDISERKQSQELIRHLAYYDPLTDLPNRILFRDRLEQTIAAAGRSGQLCALLYLDLDRFKNINDTLGHPAGDQLLQHVAQRLRARLREGDTVARLGGDEFAVILQGLRRIEDAGHTAKQLLATFKEAFLLEGHQLFVTASIGISLCPNDSSNPDLLIKSADIALYRVKAAGKNQYCFFTLEMEVETAARMTLENELRIALENGQLSLHYQPQVCLRTGSVIGMEALLRWNHPERGFISPARFIPVAEDSGLIVPIGEWVLRTACVQSLA